MPRTMLTDAHWKKLSSLMSLSGPVYNQPKHRITLEGIGKSVTGNTTKIHMAVDSGGTPVEFNISGGEVQDSKVAPELIDKLPYVDYIIADKGYDCEPLREQLKAKEAIPVIPRKKNSKVGNKG